MPQNFAAILNHLKKKFTSRKSIWYFSFGGILLLLFWLSLPGNLFDEPVCAVLQDRQGNLLGATIAADGQWRFPHNNEVPEKFAEALITYEDKRFYSHWGVDVLSVARATRQNIQAGRVVSGGSTLTMQVMRLSHKSHGRHVWQKLLETLQALRLELTHSKKEVLALYASNAPFGGNIVGLDAAAWRYFGRSAKNLTWAEAATLAVLPNSPAMVHPGRNRGELKRKRDFVLAKLVERQVLDSLEFALAVEEPLPDKPHPLPVLAPHLLMRAAKGPSGKILQSTLQHNVQRQVNQILHNHQRNLSENHIYNAAALVIDVETGDVLAYTGNVWEGLDEKHGPWNDMVAAPRSTGSILKPILYAAMLNEGELLPRMLLADIPTQIGGYTPRNFEEGYDGAVPANKALSRSLNIPAVRMLQQYGVEKLYDKLEALGIGTLKNAPGHYGLSLILGGSEATLWDLCGMYASLARTLNHYEEFNGRYAQEDIRPPTFYPAEKKVHKKESLTTHSVLNAGAIYSMFDAMEEVSRPDEELQWRQYLGSRRVAWKTGTSFGFRDAWAIGVTPRYVVGVWVGNADGEGRTGLTGSLAAAPILFNIFGTLPDKSGKWFSRPYDDMVKLPVCRQSGYRTSNTCPDADTVWVPAAGTKAAICPYHKLVHLDATGLWQVNSSCTHTSSMKHMPWFVLPPAMEWYYRRNDASYKPLPPLHPDCAANISGGNIEMIYPKELTRLFVPVQLDGTTGKAVFEAAHRNRNARVHWHLDESYVGTTQGKHQMALAPEPGKHWLVLTDENGERLELPFEVLERGN